MQPSLFKQLSYDQSLDPLFRSADVQPAQMRVETYGGASWLTEFSLLAGVSTYSFGGMRQFVQTFMQNKLKTRCRRPWIAAVPQRRVLPGAELRVQRPILHVDRNAARSST